MYGATKKRSTFKCLFNFYRLTRSQWVATLGRPFTTPPSTTRRGRPSCCCPHCETAGREATATLLWSRLQSPTWPTPSPSASLKSRRSSPGTRKTTGCKKLIFHGMAKKKWVKEANGSTLNSQCPYMVDKKRTCFLCLKRKITRTHSHNWTRHIWWN